MSAPNALITLSELKAHLGITSSSDDVRLLDLIDAASAMIERYCETAFIRQTFVERHSGVCKVMFLRRYPIVAVNQIVDPAGNIVPKQDFVVDSAKGILRHFGRFPTAMSEYGQPDQWMVSYVAGRFDNVRQVAPDLKLACVRLVDFHKSMPIAPGDVSSVGVGGISVSYVAGDESAGGFSQSVKDLLIVYRSGSGLIA